MLCEKCKKRTATVFYNENMNGKIHSYSLCGECAAKLREKGEIQDITSMIGSFADPFSELHDQFFSGFFGLSPQKIASAQKKCPSCASTYADLSRSGRVGCPICYETFADELAGLISSLHAGTSHVGGAPSRHRARLERSNQLKALREELQAAIENEEYERAVELRDQIRAMEDTNGKEEK